MGWKPVRTTLFVAVTILLAACASRPGPAHWGGPDVHLVDGYWIGTEAPCDVASTDRCADEIKAAETSLSLDPSSIARAAIAQRPIWEAVDSDGHVTMYMDTRSGVAVFAVLDLVDGSRRAVGIGCVGVPPADGSNWCRTEAFDDYRDGHIPKWGPSASTGP